MTAHDDGGPAFPARPTETLSSGATISAHHGMSLRDWFAGQALAGLYAGRPDGRIDASPDALAYDAGAAFAIADAMLAARKGGAA